jgi:hypothetical protein
MGSATDLAHGAARSATIAGVGWLWHRRPRDHVFDEAESYARSYGDRNGEVKIVHVARPSPRRPRYPLEVTGEQLRAAFARRLDGRSR